MKKSKRIRKVRVNARISEVDYAQIVQITRRKGLTVSDAIREAVLIFNTEVPIQTTISPENLSRLQEYCSQSDITAAALVRKLVSRFLTNWENRMKKSDPFDTSDLSGQSVMSENFEI